jgi:hypothetical protein
MLTDFNSNGFSVGSSNVVNDSGDGIVAWSFLKKAGFMDIVEYAGDNNLTQTINHSLAADVGMLIVKRLNSTGGWYVWHRSQTGNKYGRLDLTNAWTTAGNVFNSDPTSTQFTVGNEADVNTLGGNYIAYLFAHSPAQGIACGTFTTDGSGNATVTGLGFRPKWLLVKRSDSSGNWFMLDTERGWGAGDDAILYANDSAAETTNGIGAPTSNGFTFNLDATATFIYMAIG